MAVERAVKRRVVLVVDDIEYPIWGCYTSIRYHKHIANIQSMDSIHIHSSH